MTTSRPRTVRFHLTTLVFASVVPILIFAVIVMALFDKQQHTSLTESRRETARALAVAVDQELLSSISTLQALATSEHLDKGDLKAFYAQAQRVLTVNQRWRTINLMDPSRQQLLNLLRPFGTPLPPPRDLPAVGRAVEIGEVTISDLFVGRVVDAPIIAIAVPVIRDGRLLYLLGAALHVASFGRPLSEIKLPPESVAMIFDRQGIILARTRGIEQWLGKPASDAFVAQSRQSEEGVNRTVTRDGVSVYGAYRRSRLSGWTVGLAVPVSVVDAPARTSLWVITGGGLVFLLLAVALAAMLGRRLTGGIASLSVTARALGERRALITTGASRIAEIDGVEREMTQAARERADAEDRARALAEVSDRRRREGEALAEVGRTLSQSLDVTEVARRIADHLRALFDAENAAVFRLEPESQDLATVAASGDVGPMVPESVTFPQGTGVVGLTVQTRQVVSTLDLLTDPRVVLTETARVRIEQAPYRAVLAAPLIVADRVIGALGIGVRPGRTFTNEETALVKVFADQAATALENARLYQATQQAYEDLKQAQDRLLQAQKLESIGQLAAGIAHDFNNLLTVIGGRAQLATARLDPGSEVRRDLEMIESAATRAAALTRQLLAFGRKQVLQIQVLDLQAVVDGIRRLFERTLGEDITITIAAASDLARVKADPAQLEQVLMNLVVNARDAMPHGGQLTIEMSNVELDETYTRLHAEVSSGLYVMLAVSDTGTGMDRATQARIFEPFFTTKEPGRGTGLGLATTYGIVKQSNGHIAVYSEPGRGTTFKIYLPRVDDVLPPPSREPARTAAGGSETILLVEDEDGVRDLAHEILTSLGYTVLVAADPDAALLAAERHRGPIHLVVTDVVMPQMSGPELIERLTTSRPDIRVLYMSGYADGTIQFHGGLAAGLSFLQKPFTPGSLSRKVREAAIGTGQPGTP